ncbi:hypothetical protein [Sediminibacterium sp.]|uniref:hypothetical protein n=1 Tax=Sediminibacterium sp. TaxID=1917865 RepID=UPI003F71C93D
MKKIILIFLFIQLSLTVFSQTISSDLLIENHTVQINYRKEAFGFTISSQVIFDKRKIVVSDTLVDLKQDPFIYLIDSQIKKLLDSIIPKVSAKEHSLNKDEKIKIFEKIQQSIKFSEIKYGVAYYYGLTDEEKKLLADKKAALLDFQEKQHILKKSGITKWEDRIKAKVLKEEINVLSRKRKYEVSFIGNANVVTSFKVANQSQLGGGFGLMAYKPNRAEFIGVFTVSQANDTITSNGTTNNDFAQSVLIPGVRRFSLFTTFRLNSLWPLAYNNITNKIGFIWNVNVTPYNWLIKNSSNQDSIQAKALPISMDFMFPVHWVSIYEPGKDILISSDFGFTARYIAGDINTEKRAAFLGNNKAFYAGLIAGLSIKYNGFRFQFHAPIIFGKQVPGLTNGQAYASISIITKIFNDVGNVLDKKVND